ncbi:hypothetical protein PIB30_069161 [Stylosanthes scabra]|uniref:Uncharacterized protein n=1 Tax=Stylosanthes scabra TaxID=79078 RepID=A0ABU6ZLV6_9FABA|nr:hypothetical protein [Stylosanthes scabra]
MSRRKTPAVKLKNVPSKDPPQLSQLPLRRWFANKELWEDYQSFYSKMPILPPRFLSEGLLPEDKHPEFWDLLDYYGLRPLLFTRERYYPRMMAAVATTLRVHDGIYDSEGDGELRLRFSLAGFKYTLDLDQLSSISGLRNSGVLFKGGSEVPKRLTSFDSETAAQRLRVSRITGKKYSNTGLGHGALWTKIFEHLGVDLSGDEAVLVDDKNAITTCHLNKMGRGPKAAAERNEEAGKGRNAILLCENVQGMHLRLDACESRLSSLDKEIQGFGNDMCRFFSRAAQSEDQGHQDDAPDQE